MSSKQRRTSTVWRWWVDGVAFFAFLIAGQFIAIHGKAVFSKIFSAGPDYLRQESGGLAFGVALLAAFALALLRASDWRARSKARVAMLVCLVAPAPELMAGHPSILVAFLHMLFLAMAGGVVWVETLMRLPMQVAYWELLFEHGAKAAKILLVAYGVLVTILGVVSKSAKEDVFGYLTTLAYPTTVVAMILFMFAYWVMEPTWQQIVVGHRKKSYLRVPS